MCILLPCTWDIYADHKRNFKGLTLTQNMFSAHRRNKLKVNNKISRNSPNTWKLSNMLLNRSKKKVSVEIGKYPKLNDSNNLTYQNLRNVVKPLLRKKIPPYMHTF